MKSLAIMVSGGSTNNLIQVLTLLMASVHGDLKVRVLFRDEAVYRLTPEKINAIEDGRARLFFFARGEYKDSLGRVYPWPFCRMYDKDMPGNLIMCPDQMTIK